MHMLRKKCHELDGMGLMNDNDWLFHSYGVFESSDDAHFLLSNIKTERSVDITPEQKWSHIHQQKQILRSNSDTKHEKQGGGPYFFLYSMRSRNSDMHDNGI